MLNKSGLQHLSYRSIERLFYFVLNVSTYFILPSIAGGLDFSLMICKSQCPINVFSANKIRDLIYNCTISSLAISVPESNSAFFSFQYIP